MRYSSSYDSEKVRPAGGSGGRGMPMGSPSASKPLPKKAGVMGMGRLVDSKANVVYVMSRLRWWIRRGR